MHRITAFVCLFALACIGHANAHVIMPTPPHALVSLDVVDRETGRTLPVHAHLGERWIAGTPGHRYAVRLTNRSGQRVLAVLSVDGVNAISGETASPQQTGYVLEPYQSAEITGWRKNLSQIAAFEFTALSNSYAARTGRPFDVGVIGVAVFREKPQADVAPPQFGAMPRECCAAKAESETAAASPADRAAAPAAQANGLSRSMPAPAQESLGTGHGAREQSSARHVAFERASASPDDIVSLRYDNETNLVAMGVIARTAPSWRRTPQAFPAGFVPDP